MVYNKKEIANFLKFLLISVFSKKISILRLSSDPKSNIIQELESYFIWELAHKPILPAVEIQKSPF